MYSQTGQLSEDGTQLTFYLRQGVTFHDGEPFNAEAAIANIESWHINPSFASLPGVVNYEGIKNGGLELCFKTAVRVKL